MSSTAKKPTKAKTSKSAARSTAKEGSTLPKTKVIKEKVDATSYMKADSVQKPATPAATPTVVNKPQAVVMGPLMRKKELIDTVVSRSGMKKKDAKPVIESMLAVLGEALADGRELALPPLGKVMVRKEKRMPNGKVMMVKIRQSNPSVPAEPKPFSDAAE